MELSIVKMPDKHIEDVIDPDVPPAKKRRGGKNSKSKDKGRGRNRR
jgi:hypothetical protein